MLHYTLTHSSSSIFNTDAVLPNPLKRFQCFLILLRENPKCYASLSSPCGLCCTDRLSFLPFVQEHWLPHVPQYTEASQLRTLNILRHFSVLQLPAHCHPLGALPYLSTPLPFSTTLIMPCKGKGLMVPNTSQQHTADLSEHVPG